ncbi:hypothetical protein [Moraxella bovis]|uniref:Uncharacterized protein n=1 Tax=Moraxella bovis TaxID=476 RepID=A0ABY6M7T5_MORBO|nr:hypothetical protein [Moraxella bovis]UZA02941.1 hypothetical protein LP092_13550 [Moraxella bovis]UZA54034.1 hypothetical protein LP111_12765 [Moraxella bovis]UZA57360.1 hypothetical protein LP127_01410 [Moraxella bovis]
MKETFKAGDKVYFPAHGFNIHELKGASDFTYPINLTIGTQRFSFTEQGYFIYGQGVPSIFLATRENHKKLTEFYSMAFEEPPKPKLPREVIQAMLDDGWKYVPCFVSDSKMYPDTTCSLTLIKSIKDNGLFRDTSKLYWSYAVPFDLKTSKPIIDYVNGQIVTE